MSYVQGIYYCAGEKLAIDNLFVNSVEKDAELEFYQSRGLKFYREQHDSTKSMCMVTVNETLRRSKISPSSIGMVVIDYDNWHGTPEDELQIFEGLHAAGVLRVPIVGLCLQSCSGFATALDVADRSLRTDPERKPILVLLCGRIHPHSSRLDPVRATIYSDGMASFVVTSEPGQFKLETSIIRTNIDAARSNVECQKNALSLARGFPELSQIANTLYRSLSIEPNDIEALFCTNGSIVYTNVVAQAARVPMRRTYTENIADFAHIYSCDHAISLATYDQSKDFVVGGKYMLIGWSAFIYSGVVLSYEGSVQ